MLFWKHYYRLYLYKDDYHQTMLHFIFCYSQTIYHFPLKRLKGNSSSEGLWYVWWKQSTTHHRESTRTENQKAFNNLLTAGTLEEWAGWGLYVVWLIM